jgi:ATP-dependent DNA helicase RecG
LYYSDAELENLLRSGESHRDTPYDIRPVFAATLADLDEQRFEAEYLPVAVAPDVLARNERTLPQRLAATKMIAQADEPAPTILGLLVLGKATLSYVPGAYVQFLRISGTVLGDPIVDEERIDGTVLDVAKQLEAKLIAHNRVAVDLTTGFRESRSPVYPLPALQQVARNAILHRSYENTNAPVRVNWYNDRIEFLSPGGPYGTVTPENFGAPGVTDYRNPNLAEAMRVLGLVQRFGVGIATAQRELANNGNPPLAFTITANHVLVTVRPAR